MLSVEQDEPMQGVWRLKGSVFVTQGLHECLDGFSCSLLFGMTVLRGTMKCRGAVYSHSGFSSPLTCQSPCLREGGKGKTTAIRSVTIGQTTVIPHS